MIKAWATWAAVAVLVLGVTVIAGAEDPLAAGATHSTAHHSHKKSHRQAHASSNAHHKTHAHHRSTHAAASAHAKPAPTAVQ